MTSKIAKIGKKVLKVVMWTILTILLVAVGYILFNTPFSSSIKTLTADELRVYTSALDASLSEPRQFVAQKFDQHDVVLIGEMHWKKQDLDFVKGLIPYLFREKGVKVFGWEFGASDLQAEADAIVNAPEFDRHRAIAFMRKSSFSWNFEEYLEIVQTIWAVNHSIPDGQEKMRFLQLGSDYNPGKLHSPDPIVRAQEARRFPYDQKMGQIIEREVLAKHAKALWYSGMHHAITRYRQPGAFFLKSNGVRGGRYLYLRYPERIYMIQLSMPYLDRFFLARYMFPAPFGYRMLFVPAFRGAFEEIYRAYKKPFAVDTSNPLFGDLADSHSYYALDRWNGLPLREMSDGYIMIGANADMQPVGLIPDWVTTDAELQEVKSVLPAEDAARIPDIPALLKYIAEDTQRVGLSSIAQSGSIVSHAR